LIRYVWQGGFLPSRDWEKENISFEEKWVRILKHFDEQNILLPNVVKVTEFAFSLHGTSALVESVFPFMNSV
jgi:hypothetical protein